MSSGGPDEPLPDFHQKGKSSISPKGLLRKAKKTVTKATEAVRQRGRRKQDPLQRAAAQASANTRKQLESQSVSSKAACILACTCCWLLAASAS